MLFSRKCTLIVTRPFSSYFFTVLRFFRQYYVDQWYLAPKTWNEQQKKPILSPQNLSRLTFKVSPLNNYIVLQQALVALLA